MSYGSAGAFAGYSPQPGARKRQSLPLLSSLSGYLESWNLADSSKRWQNLARTTPATATNDPVAVVDPDSGTTALRIINGGGTDRPLVTANGIATDGVNDYLAALSTGLSTQTGGVTVAMRMALLSSPAQYDGAFSVGSTNDYIDGIAQYWDKSGSINATNLNTWSAAAGNNLRSVSIDTFAFGTFVTIVYFISPTTNTSKLWINGTLVSDTISATSASISMGKLVVSGRYESGITKYSSTEFRKLALFAGDKTSDVATITAIMES